MAKILVIDDEKLLREALHKGLSGEGWDVTEASDGETGFETAISTHPDVILLDIIMPGMDGVTVLRKLRQDPWGRDAKVVILTNLESEKKVHDVTGLNANGYFVKSNWKIEDIIAMIKNIL